MTVETQSLPAAARGLAPCKRSVRRHYMERAKARAAKVWRGWKPSREYSKSISARDLQRHIGRMAAMHCTHMCFMCKHEKKLNMPSVSDLRSDLYFRDLDIETAQDQWDEYIGYLAILAEECDEMRSAFGHDGHRSMLMTQYEADVLQGERLRTAAGKS